MSTPSSIVGEQKSSGRSPLRNRSSRSSRSSRVDLGGVLARFEHALQIHEAAVALDEVAVDLGRDLAGLQQARAIDRANLAIGRQPAQGVGVELVARVVAVARAAHLLDDAVALQREEQEADRLIHLGTAEGLLPGAHEAPGHA